MDPCNRAIELERQLYLSIRHYWIILSDSQPLSVHDTVQKREIKYLFVEFFKFNIRAYTVWSMKPEEFITEIASFIYLFL